MNTRNQVSCVLEKNNLDSYLVVVATAIKGRATLIIEYDRNNIPSVLKENYIKNGRAGEPVLADCDLMVIGVPSIFKYLDMRFPLPVLEGGSSVQYGRRMAFFDAFLVDFRSALSEYRSTRNKNKYYVKFCEIARQLDYGLANESKSLQYIYDEPTSVQCLLAAVLLMMEENNLTLEVARPFKRFYAYMRQIKENPMYINSQFILDKSRESEPFWELEGFDESRYKSQRNIA